MTDIITVQDLVSARASILQAESLLQHNAKQVLNDVVLAVFRRDSEITSVSWAQKSSEYNDEGMYHGVFGPAINQPYDGSGSSWYDLGWTTSYVPVPTELRGVEEVLKALGVDILAQIFGDEAIVNARRINVAAVCDSTPCGMSLLPESKFCPECGRRAPETSGLTKVEFEVEEVGW